MHQMCISTTEVSSVSLRTKKLEIYSVVSELHSDLNWLMIDYLLFYSRSRCMYMYVTIDGKIGHMCSAIWAFEQGKIFIEPHLLWHGDLVFPVSSEGPPHLVASYNTQDDAEDLFLPGSSRVTVTQKWVHGVVSKLHSTSEANTRCGI
jgi:hypothetical protein